MTNHFSAIVDLLQTYLDGLYYSDTSKLRQVLHPQARYICATEDDIVNLSMEEYFPIVDKRPAPASRGEARHDRIVSIEFAGPKTAVARVNCAIGPKHFTDLLTLILVEEKWQIISKVFHFDLLNQD